MHPAESTSSNINKKRDAGRHPPVYAVCERLIYITYGKCSDFESVDNLLQFQGQRGEARGSHSGLL